MMRQQGVIVRQKSAHVTSIDGKLEKLEQLFKEEPVEEPAPVPETRVSEESEAVMQLVLETMAHMQAEIKGLRDSISEKVQAVIRFEMKGINTLVGEIQPELADLDPEQLVQIKNMIGIMKMAYGSRK